MRSCLVEGTPHDQPSLRSLAIRLSPTLLLAGALAATAAPIATVD